MQSLVGVESIGNIRIFHPIECLNLMVEGEV